MTSICRDIERVLISEKEIQNRVRELGKQISEDYKGKRPILVAVLRGAIVFLCDLMRYMSIPVTVDFLSVSSYSGHIQTGVVKILKDLDENIAQRHVILIEDIVDTGLTLSYIIKTLETRNPANIGVCALLDKRSRRVVDVPVDYVGFVIPDEFVVGYGMDYNQKYRNLPFIGVLRREILQG